MYFFLLSLFFSLHFMLPTPAKAGFPRRNSCSEPHFWCKYRHKSEILQTKSNIFSEKAKKIEQKPRIYRFFNILGHDFA